MQFFKDDRVSISEPTDRSTVNLPVELRWGVAEFAITGRDGKQQRNSGYFAVFVDRQPVPPGKSLEWLAQQDGSCGFSACGSVDKLPGVYVTEEISLELSEIPATEEVEGAENHEVTIVLMDGTGKRIGESAFYVRFTLEREA